MIQKHIAHGSAIEPIPKSKPPQTYAKDRVCTSCHFTRLSIFNPGNRCAPCQHTEAASVDWDLELRFLMETP